MLAAVQAAIRAILTAHPNPHAVLAAFKFEHAETMAILLAQPLPDVAIQSYKDALRGMAPDPATWLES
jgi:hypothetical protein